MFQDWKWNPLKTRNGRRNKKARGKERKEVAQNENSNKYQSGIQAKYKKSRREEKKQIIVQDGSIKFEKAYYDNPRESWITPTTGNHLIDFLVDTIQIGILN